MRLDLSHIISYPDWLATVREVEMRPATHTLCGFAAYISIT